MNFNINSSNQLILLLIKSLINKKMQSINKIMKIIKRLFQKKANIKNYSNVK